MKKEDVNLRIVTAAVLVVLVVLGVAVYTINSRLETVEAAMITVQRWILAHSAVRLPTTQPARSVAKPRDLAPYNPTIGEYTTTVIDLEWMQNRVDELFRQATTQPSAFTITAATPEENEALGLDDVPTIQPIEPTVTIVPEYTTKGAENED